MFIVGVAALYRPIPVNLPDLVPTLAFGAVVVAVIVPSRQGMITREHGFVLLLVYAAYLATLL